MAGDAPAGTPAANLRDAVRQEFARIARPPYETLLVVAINGALMSSAWFFLPEGLKDDVFSLHGSLSFALVLAAWMYSDVPATNVLGPDAERALAALDDPVALRRLLAAKNIALWTLITPVCLLVAVGNGLIFTHDALATLYVCILIGIVPPGAVAISAWVGIVLPYHPMPLRYRWEHQRPRRRMFWRWLVLVITPYGLVPFLGATLMAPSLLLWGFTTSGGLSQQLPDNDLGGGVAVACVVAAVCWFAGQRVSTVLVRRRRARLATFLSDPTRG